MQRKPSHFGSNHQAPPSGNWPADLASIGAVTLNILTAISRERGLRLKAANRCSSWTFIRHQRRSSMPAKSAAQQKAAGAALSAKRGDTPKSKRKGASKSMGKSMSEQ